MQVNFLSHFYLTNLIIQRQTAGRSSTFTHDQGEAQRSRSLRVINVASSAYSRGSMEHLDEMTSLMTSGGRGNDEEVSWWSNEIYQSYADSKLAMMLFTTELNFRHSINNVVCIAAHPGNSYLHRTITCIILAPNPKTHRRRDIIVELSRVGSVYGIRN